MAKRPTNLTIEELKAFGPKAVEFDLKADEAVSHRKRISRLSLKTTAKKMPRLEKQLRTVRARKRVVENVA